MKLHRIAGNNLASLSRPFELWLDEGPLARGGLFAITGPTGAGKSTILDALCLALYNTTPRLTGRRGPDIVTGVDKVGVNDVRSLVRRGSDVAWAEVEFTGVDGERWVARWSVQRRPRKGDLDESVVQLRRADASAHETGRKTETLERIRELVGLEYNSFVRSVLLAQGEFARLLSATADERSAALEWITRSGVYSELSRGAHARGKQAEAAIGALAAQVAAVPVLGEAERKELAERRAAADAAVQAARAEADRAAAAASWVQERDRRRGAVAARTQEAQAAGVARLALTADAERLARATAAQRAAPALRAEASAAEQLAHHERELQARQGAVAAALAALPPLREGLAAAAAELAAAEHAREAGMVTVAAARELDGRLRESDERRRSAARAWGEAQERAAHLARADERAGAALRAAQGKVAAAEAWLAEHPRAARLAPSWRILGPRLRAWADAADAEVRAAQDVVHTAARAEAAATELALAQPQAQARADELAAARAAFLARDADTPARAAEAARLGDLGAALERRRTAQQRASAVQHEAEGLRGRLAELGEQIAAARAAALLADTAAAEAESRLAELRVRADETARTLRSLEARRSLAAHREELRDGEPCPLCGATEHPLAGKGVVDELVAEVRARAEALAGEVRTLADTVAHERGAATARAGEAARLGEPLRAAQARLAELAAAGVLAPHEPGTAAAAAALAQADTELAGELHALGAARKALADAEAEAARLGGALDRAQRAAQAADRALRDAQAAVERAAAAEDRARAEVERLAKDRVARAAELDDWLGAPAEPWREALAVPAARELLRIEVETAIDTLAARDEHRAAAALAATAAAVAHAEAVAAAEAVPALAAADGAAGAAHAALTEQRAAVLAGPADAAEQALARAVAGATAAHQAHAQALRDAEQAARDAGSRLTQEGSRSEALREAARVTAAEAEAALAGAALARAEAEAVLAWWAEQGPATAARVADADRAVAEAQTRLRMAEAERAALAGPEGVDPEADSATLAAEAAAARATHEALLADAVRLAEQLAQDDRNRSEREDREKRHAAARADADAWLLLDAAIGHSSGRTLREYAQSLTLARLLQEANLLLDDLAPRYQLDRVPGSPLDLMVVDRDRGNEVRGVQTLSGGETFLISLAMALGLSAIAARRQPLNCLFIDEGFGMLDARSMDQALALLESLRQSGRTIGIISHVAGLAERVATRVEVTPIAMGSSVVRIVEG